MVIFDMTIENYGGPIMANCHFLVRIFSGKRALISRVQAIVLNGTPYVTNENYAQGEKGHKKIEENYFSRSILNWADRNQ